jgi:uncharacterized membrane protein
MNVLIAGLVIFLGVHSLRIVAEGWRQQQIVRLGEGPWKGLYSLASGLGLALVVWGFSLARQHPVLLWAPPSWTRHVTALLMVFSFVLVVAAYVPRNALKARLGHPMLLGVKTWAFAHLITNGTLADVLLFGGFLVWAVLCFRSARARDRAAGTVYPAGTLSGTVIAVVVGLFAYALFAFWLHGWLFGVRPFG